MDGRERLTAHAGTGRVTHGRRIDVQLFDVRVGSRDLDDLEHNAGETRRMDSMSLVTIVEYNKTSVRRQGERCSSYILPWNGVEWNRMEENRME